MRILDSPRERAQALVLILGVSLVVALAPFATGLLGAGVLFVIVAPVQRWLVRHLAPAASAAVVVALAALLVLLPGAALLLLVVEQAPATLQGIEDSALLARVAALRLAGIDVGAEIAAASGSLASWASRRAFAFVGSATHAALNLVVALFGLYYLLLAPAAAWREVGDYLPFSAASVDALGARFVSVTEAMLLGVGLTAVLQGSIVGLGFRIVGLQDALFWGAVTAFASILPVLGSALVWLPASLVLLLEGRYGAALTLAAIGGLLASNIDNVTRPMVYRRISRIHPMATVVGAFAGIARFGLLGILLGPLAITWFFELLAIYRREYGSPPAREDGAAAGDAMPARAAPVARDAPERVRVTADG